MGDLYSRCAHGDAVLYPVAQPELETAGLYLCVKGAVSKSLPVTGKLPIYTVSDNALSGTV